MGFAAKLVVITTPNPGLRQAVFKLGSTLLVGGTSMTCLEQIFYPLLARNRLGGDLSHGWEMDSSTWWTDWILRTRDENAQMGRLALERFALGNHRDSALHSPRSRFCRLGRLDPF